MSIIVSIFDSNSQTWLEKFSLHDKTVSCMLIISTPVSHLISIVVIMSTATGSNVYTHIISYAPQQARLTLKRHIILFDDNSCNDVCNNSLC